MAVAVRAVGQMRAWNTWEPAKLGEVSQSSKVIRFDVGGF
jgi:hypothetical protein